MQWNVTAQVQAMLDDVDHGFVIRSAAEDTDASAEADFHSREKGESPPELVIRFGAPPSNGPPGPPAPPAPAAVSCGLVLTQSTRVTNDLSECPGDGLVIGAPRIIVDLDGHTIDGVGLGAGIRNDGYESVTVRDGTVQDFDYGVRLLSETRLNVIERLTLRVNQLAGIELFDAWDNEIRANTVDDNGAGIALVSGTRGTIVVDNTMTLNGGPGLLVRDSDANRLERNSVSGGGDLGVGLERASGNTLLGNTVSANSDGGIELLAGSHGNRVEGNTVSESGDTGIRVVESDRTELISNITHGMSDSGISLETANDGIVRDNDLRFSPGGLQMDGASRNLVAANRASETTGIGIELGGGSFDNDLVQNTANHNAAQGIYVADEALADTGNLLDRNTASGNMSSGIVTAKGGHILVAHTTHDNKGWGINAALGTIDGGGNVASGNSEPGQCLGILCSLVADPPDSSDLEAPDTTITGGPAAGDGSASFAFTGSDNRTVPAELKFECRLDGQDWVPCSSPQGYANLGSEPHTFEVRAIDEAGNVDPTPASHSWTEEPPTCTPQTITSGATADSWVLQDSATSNYGDDTILKVDSKSGANARALVSFGLPVIPSGCQVVDVKLRLYASSYKEGRTLQALALAAPWSEGGVTWSNQPAASGAAAEAASVSGYVEWSVTSQVRDMYAGANHGFLIRDSAEGGGGILQGFHSREKAPDQPPELVITFE
jgi:parallel beta-helix repeat protein